MQGLALDPELDLHLSQPAHLQKKRKRVAPLPAGGSLIFPTVQGEKPLPHPSAHGKEAGKEEKLRLLGRGGQSVEFPLQFQKHSELLHGGTVCFAKNPVLLTGQEGDQILEPFRARACLAGAALFRGRPGTQHGQQTEEPTGIGLRSHGAIGKILQGSCLLRKTVFRLREKSQAEQGPQPFAHGGGIGIKLPKKFLGRPFFVGHPQPERLSLLHLKP